MSMDVDQMKKAKMFFEFAIEFYPNSANVYDAMADYFERNKDYESAIKYVAMASRISGDEYYKERIEALKNK